MWVSRKKWEELVNRVADLEKRIQDQPLEIISALNGCRIEQMRKANRSSHQQK